MKKNIKTMIGYAILILIILAVIAITVVPYILYGNKPITEVPFWALSCVGVRGR